MNNTWNGCLHREWAAAQSASLSGKKARGEVATGGREPPGAMDDVRVQRQASSPILLRKCGGWVKIETFWFL